MKLRTKLLVLLLLTALVPLFIVRGIDVMGMHHLGKDVGEQARQQLTDETEQGLARVVEAIALLIDREELICRMLLSEQVQAVEERLAGPMPIEAAPIFGPDEFHIDGRAVTTLTPSERHGRHSAGQDLRPVQVSYDHQVTLFLPDADGDRVADLAQRLADMPTAYRHARECFPERLLWQYTTLAEGLHTSFPGKADYPDGYDPRRREWYRKALDPPPLARSADGQVWTTVLDVSTRQVTLTLSQSIHGPDGEPVGVTALDVPMDTVLDNTRLGVDWSSQARLMIVSLEQPETMASYLEPNAHDDKHDGSEDGALPVVFADTGADVNRQDWEQSFKFNLLALDDAEAQARVVDDIRAGRSGVAHTDLKGRAMVVAYGPVDAPTPMAVLVAAPLDLVTERAHAIETRVIDRTWRLITWTEWIAVLVVAAVVFMAWRGSRSVTRPVTTLADAANRIADGDLYTSADAGDRRDELGDLGRAFNAMVPKLRDNLAVREALGVAQEVQQSLLPRHAAKLPGLDFAGLSDYCDETGGDYFDYLEFDALGDHRVGVALGDVTGHGIGAALLMATARALLRARAALPGTLVELFTDVNQHLCASRFDAKFMTLFYLLVEAEPEAVRVRWISAGHDPAIVYDPRSDTFEDWAGADIPLGVEPTWAFHEFEKTLTDAAGSGRVVVLGTDGIWEAREPGDTMYGKTRLNEVIRRHAAASAHDIAAAILADVHRFRETREQLDDITLVVFKFE
ncbi:MAG: SpoIIE family protein phosphatase [Planctomycetota bacterium]